MWCGFSFFSYSLFCNDERYDLSQGTLQWTSLISLISYLLLLFAGQLNKEYIEMIAEKVNYGNKLIFILSLYCLTFRGALNMKFCWPNTALVVKKSFSPPGERCSCFSRTPTKKYKNNFGDNILNLNCKKVTVTNKHTDFTWKIRCDNRMHTKNIRERIHNTRQRTGEKTRKIISPKMPVADKSDNIFQRIVSCHQQQHIVCRS